VKKVNKPVKKVNKWVMYSIMLPFTR